MDTLDLYSARARAVFIAAASAELGLDPDVVKRDLGRVLLACERLADEAVTAAQSPDEPEPMGDADRAAALGLLRDPDLAGRITAAPASDPVEAFIGSADSGDPGWASRDTHQLRTEAAARRDRQHG